jgi:hypothetical protein
MKRVLVLKRKAVEENDNRKLGKLYTKLKIVSAKKAKADLQQSLVPAKSRTEIATTSPKTKLTVNIKGNLRGMHNSGDSEHMKKVRAMRRFYNKQMPQLACTSCAFASACPQFKAGYECAFLPFLNSHKIEDERDMLNALKDMASAGVRRMHLATIMETLTGGTPTLETTEALNLTFMQLAKLHEISSKSNEASLTVETEDGGIINRIFGGLGNLLDSTREAQTKPIEVLPEQLENPVDSSAVLVDSSVQDVNLDLLREHAREETDRASGLQTAPQQMPVVAISTLNK